jgi:hypothetical protein
MMVLLDLVPKWVWLAIVAALSATSCKLKLENGNLTLEVEKHETHIAQLQTTMAQADADAQKQALELERKASDAAKAQRIREASIRRDTNVASAELERLRIALSDYTRPRLTSSTATLAPSLDYADPLSELFLQCSARYIDLAGKADGHANDAQTLVDAWPK